MFPFIRLLAVCTTFSWLVGATAGGDRTTNYSGTLEEATYMAYDSTSLHISGFQSDRTAGQRDPGRTNHDGTYTFRGIKNGKPVWGKDDPDRCEYGISYTLRVGWRTPTEGGGTITDMRRCGWAVYEADEQGDCQFQYIKHVAFGSWEDHQESMLPPTRARYLQFNDGRDDEVGFTDSVHIEIRRSGEPLVPAASVLPEVLLRHAIPLSLGRGLLSSDISPLRIDEPASRTPTIDTTALQRYCDSMTGQLHTMVAEIGVLRASLAALSSPSQAAPPDPEAEAAHETLEITSSSALPPCGGTPRRHVPKPTESECRRRNGCWSFMWQRQ